MVSMNTRFEIEAAAGAGAYVHGVDLSSPLDSSVLQQLRQALGETGVLFFREQNLAPEQHIELAEHFGAININRFFTPVEQHPKIAEVRKEPTQQKNIGSEWHTDHSYDEIPAMGSILVARETPTTGGDTVFASMFSAYEALSPGLQEMLCSLRAVHSSRHVFGAAARQLRSKPGDTRIGNADAATQDAVHPVVIRHPISQRPALYINPQFTLRFDGWTQEESKPLLNFLAAHATHHQHTHRFQWQPGSVAFWDNRATWHLAINDYQGQRRLMHRVTVEGQALDPYA